MSDARSHEANDSKSAEGWERLSQFRVGVSILERHRSARPKRVVKVVPERGVRAENEDGRSTFISSETLRRRFEVLDAGSHEKETSMEQLALVGVERPFRLEWKHGEKWVAAGTYAYSKHALQALQTYGHTFEMRVVDRRTGEEIKD